jgi:hypothetical protein
MSPYVRLPDPEPRHGRCAVCYRARPPLAKLHDDPFCSTDCARAWHTPQRRAAYRQAYAFGLARLALEAAR